MENQTVLVALASDTTPRNPLDGDGGRSRKFSKKQKALLGFGIASLLGLLLLLHSSNFVSLASDNEKKSTAWTGNDLSGLYGTINKPITLPINHNPVLDDDGYKYEEDIVANLLPVIQHQRLEGFTHQEVPPIVNLQLDVTSSRPDCNGTNHTCVYRAYLLSPIRDGRFLHWNNAWNSYQTTFSVYETQYTRHDIDANDGEGNNSDNGDDLVLEFMVVLEELKNKSNTRGFHYNGLEIKAVPRGDKNGDIDVCVGERIGHSHSSVRITPDQQQKRRSFSKLYDDPSTYRETLPLCSATKTNEVLDWVPRSDLITRGFGPEDTLMIPDELIQPNQDSTLYLKQYETTANHTYMTARQDYVYFGRTCRQRWISQKDVQAFALEHLSENKLNLHFVGTSRIRSLSNWVDRFLLASDSNLGINKDTGLLTVSHESVPTEDQDALTFESVLRDSGLCKDTSANGNINTGTTMNVIFVSYGMWQLTYHGRSDTEFRFDGIAEASIRYIHENCVGQKYRIILMTQPHYHAFQGPGDVWSTPRRHYWRTDKSLMNKLRKEFLRGGLTEVVNSSIRKMAAQYNLTLVDLASASLGRMDANNDHVHYHYPETKIGNEVTVAFSQLALAGLFEEFNLDYY